MIKHIPQELADIRHYQKKRDTGRGRYANIAMATIRDDIARQADFIKNNKRGKIKLEDTIRKLREPTGNRQNQWKTRKKYEEIFRATLEVFCKDNGINYKETAPGEWTIRKG